MGKVHTYTKFAEEPEKVVTVHLATDESENYPATQCNGFWKEIGTMIETISHNLENQRPGSKFPLFHRIGGETPISKLEVTLFENELTNIKKELKKVTVDSMLLVKFRKGKSDVKQITDKELDKFHTTAQENGNGPVKTLYDSFKRPLDIHAKMCKEAKKKDTGLVWKVVDRKQVTPLIKKAEAVPFGWQSLTEFHHTHPFFIVNFT